MVLYRRLHDLKGETTWKARVINPEEFAICKRRGHGTEISLKGGWVQCRWCGMWLREVQTIEEREDEPPENERNPLPGLRRKYSGPG